MTNEAMAPSSTARPIVALAMGDPAGISPELTAMLLALPETHEAARLTVFGDRRILEKGAREAGVTLVAISRGDDFEVFTHPFRIEGAAERLSDPSTAAGADAAT